MTEFSLVRTVRKIRACEGEVAAQLVLEYALKQVQEKALKQAAEECDALGRMARNHERGLAYDIAAHCIRQLFA